MICNERSSRYYVNMINDLNNYFFYRKHHEHVPGIMMIEVARQAAYAQYYRTGTHKRGDITLTIKRLDCEFEDYVDSNYPVSVCVETDCEKAELAGKGFEFRNVRFFQNNRPVAAIEITSLPIKMKTFKRLRIVKPDPSHWFVPVKAFANSALFFDETGKRFEGRIRKVSRGGMEIAVDRKILPDTTFNFVLSVDGIGYVDGKACVADVADDGDAASSRLSILELSTEAERRWLEAIKNFSHVDSVAGSH